MGEQGARVDVSALRTIADHFDTVTELVDRAARTRLAFDGAVAGRTHAAGGDAVRCALSGVVADLGQWSRAATEVAACLRAGAGRYAEADQAAAAGIR